MTGSGEQISGDIKLTPRWRDMVDPFSLAFSDFRLLGVLGWPPAGNDVFYVEGEYCGAPCRAFIKVARQSGADVANEYRTLCRIPFSFVPRALDFCAGPPAFIVTAEAPGERLSSILGDNSGMRSLDFMGTYGRTLAMFHSLDIPCEPVKHRPFFDIAESGYFDRYGLGAWERFLRRSTPDGCSECFVHGDFHYANVLWQENRIACVLDYELSGLGIREFDMAWALCLRPGQRFLTARREIEAFLAGYEELQRFSPKAFEYYYVLIASRFFAMGDAEYREALLRLTEAAVASYMEVGA